MNWRKLRLMNMGTSNISLVVLSGRYFCPSGHDYPDLEIFFGFHDWRGGASSLCWVEARDVSENA